jgi:hypothetical protein
MGDVVKVTVVVTDVRYREAYGEVPRELILDLGNTGETHEAPPLFCGQKYSHDRERLPCARGRNRLPGSAHSHDRTRRPP